MFCSNTYVLSKLSVLLNNRCCLNILKCNCYKRRVCNQFPKRHRKCVVLLELNVKPYLQNSLISIVIEFIQHNNIIMEGDKVLINIKTCISSEYFV